MKTIGKFLALLACGSLAVVTLGASPAAANETFDVSVAKSQNGPYKTNQQDTDQPTTSTQVLTRKVNQGDKAVFFVKLKNTVGDDRSGGLGGDLEKSGYQVKVIRLKGKKNVTEELQNDAPPDCTSFTLGGNKSLTYKLTVKPTSAPDGDEEYFEIYTLSTNCFDTSDIVWPRVKVK